MYILAALFGGGFLAGPIYLGFRWWYGHNRELDNVDELRESAVVLSESDQSLDNSNSTFIG